MQNKSILKKIYAHYDNYNMNILFLVLTIVMIELLLFSRHFFIILIMILILFVVIRFMMIYNKTVIKMLFNNHNPYNY